MLAPAIEQLVKGMLKGTSLDGTEKGAQVAALLGSVLTAAASGAAGGVDAVAYAVAEYQHNYLSHPELKKFASDLKDCNGDTTCERKVGELYKALSNQNNKDLLDAIQRRDLAAVMKAVNSDNSAGIREDALLSLDPTSSAADVFDNVYWDGAKIDTDSGTEYFNLYAFMAAKEIMIEQYVSGQRSAGDIAQLMAQYLGDSIYAPKLDVFLAAMVAKVDALKSSGEKVNVTAKDIDIDAGGSCVGARCATGCSFDGSTLVKTVDGFTAIRNVQPGKTKVWSRDEQGHEGYKLALGKVRETHTETVYLTVRSNKTASQQIITTTLLHRVFAMLPKGVSKSRQIAIDGKFYSGPISNGVWIRVQDLQPGYKMLDDSGSWSDVVSVRVERKPLEAYNLTVADYHTYFVKEAGNNSAKSIWVHNDPCSYDTIFNANRLPNDLRESVNDTLSNINKGTVPSGNASIRWGTTFTNNEGFLPVKTSDGAPISYKEYRVANPYSSAPGDNVYRIVVGSDGRQYFTGTHYGQADFGTKAFVRIK